MSRREGDDDDEMECWMTNQILELTADQSIENQSFFNCTLPIIFIHFVDLFITR